MSEGDRIPNRTRFTLEGLSPERDKRMIAGTRPEGRSLVLGAVRVTGDTSDNDLKAAVAGIPAAGLIRKID